VDTSLTNASKGHGAFSSRSAMSDRRGSEDLPGPVYLRQRGTLSVTTAGQLPALSTTGLGVWRHTDGHAYSAVSEAFVFSTAGVWTQTHRLTRAIEIGNNEDEFTDTVALQSSTPTVT